MMHSVVLPGANGLRVSRFVFGTASLHHLPSRRRQSELLMAAIDSGFTHFDTAPSYGHGLAETALGPVLVANPHVTVTTKVGLYPAGGPATSQATMLIRKAVGRIWKAFSRPIVDWRIDMARRSLEGSLRRLKRNRIDLCMLHEPSADIDRDEWQNFLENEVQSGRVGAFGIAGYRWQVESFVRSGSPLARIVQTADDVVTRPADFLLEAGRPLQLTFGYLSSARPGSRAVDILSQALQRNATGAVIVSTRSIQRLGQYDQAFKAAGLLQFESSGGDE